MGKWVDNLFSMPAWLALIMVFLFPAAEASIFLGFVLPGEIAVVIGGVLAYRGTVELWTVLIAAVAGAIVGDSVGYGVGHRWGRRVLDSTVGRYVNHDHFDRGEAFIFRRGAAAVFFGRWTATLRALIPGLAGMSQVPYGKFLFWNVLGGTMWATTFVLLGYAAGNSYHQVVTKANYASWGLLGFIAIAGLVTYGVVRRRRTNENRAA